MTSKDKQNTPPVVALPGEDQPTSLGQLALQPNIRAAVTIQGYSREYGDLDTAKLAKLTAELNNELSNQARAVNEGDLKRSEGMLTIQAHTLDAIFNNLARRASQAWTTFRYLRLGLKAQSQCRATL
jgi:hypothetical protein